MDKLSGTIIVVDDDSDVLLSARLYLEQYFETVIALSKPTDLIPTVKAKGADVVLLDMNYNRGKNDGREGILLLKELKENARCEVVTMTAYGEVDLAVEAIKIGAIDFVVKPWSNEKLRATVMTALQLHKSKTELDQLKRHQQAWTEASEQEPLMLGNSEAMQRVREIIEQVAPTDANVLILGENGTGKEVAAQLIHHRSIRMSNPFVKVDLGAVHENLFESELFGAKKGAYTDLKQDRIGRFELAQQGTLFLDEIGNLSVATQSKLLSALQNRSVIPVGATKAVSIDVRLITATNADLPLMLEDKTFRQDLLYRINTIEITMPPLRERTEDIPELAQHFMAEYARKYRKPLPKLGANELRSLSKYPWPGNVRELRHAVERAVIMSSNGQMSEASIIPKQHKRSPEKSGQTLDDLERQHIFETVERMRGNISQAAKELGLTRAALYRRIEKYGL